MPINYPKPPYPGQKQPMPGLTSKMDPRPDHGETSYKGSGRLQSMKAVITGGDSGIGRAVAIAYDHPNCCNDHCCQAEQRCDKALARPACVRQHRLNCLRTGVPDHVPDR